MLKRREEINESRGEEDEDTQSTKDERFRAKPTVPTVTSSVPVLQSPNLLVPPLSSSSSVRSVHQPHSTVAIDHHPLRGSVRVGLRGPFSSSSSSRSPQLVLDASELRLGPLQHALKPLPSGQELDSVVLQLGSRDGSSRRSRREDRAREGRKTSSVVEALVLGGSGRRGDGRKVLTGRSDGREMGRGYRGKVVRVLEGGGREGRSSLLGLGDVRVRRRCVGVVRRRRVGRDATSFRVPQWRAVGRVHHRSEFEGFVDVSVRSRGLLGGVRVVRVGVLDRVRVRVGIRSRGIWAEQVGWHRWEGSSRTVLRWVSRSRSSSGS